METMNQVKQDTVAPAEVSPQPVAGDVEAEALAAARELAAALAETPQFKALDQAGVALRHDSDAQAAIHAFQQRQRDLGWKLQTGLISDAERQHLKMLQMAMLAKPAVRAYMNAQQQFARVCYEASELVSEIIGLPFAASCGPDCSCH